MTGFAARVRRSVGLARDMARLAVGIPSYDVYLAHMLAYHQDRQPMSPAEFFRERQMARYGGGAGRCC